MDDRDVERLGDELEGRRIDLIVAGGIAAVESPKLCRELRRYGADVHVIMTQAAQQFITPLALEWASKNSVTTDLSGRAEHITQADLVLVAPCTLDFTNRIALGLADSAALTLIQSALSRIPICLVPSMHSSLEANPIYQKNLKFLRTLKNLHFMEPVKAEGKSKQPSVEEIAAFACHVSCQSDLANPLADLSVLVTLGATRSYLDDVRFIGNESSGATGLAIADAFYRAGARVEILHGVISKEVPSQLRRGCSVTEVESHSEFLASIKTIMKKRNRPRLGIFSAAILDFEVQKRLKGKTSSQSKELSFSLRPTKKILAELKNLSGLKKVGFKLESGLTDVQLKGRAQDSIREHDLDLCVANHLNQTGGNRRRALLVDSKQVIAEVHSNRELAQGLRSWAQGIFKKK